MTQFIFKNVWFRYGNEHDWVLKDINLEIRKGEFVIILGHNGCGKTTLLKHFNKLLKPNKGEILFEGKDLKSYKDFEVFSKVGFLFQDPNDQIFATTVEEDVSFGPLNMGLSPEEIEERVVESLSLVGMLEYRKAKIHELSYGQKQRVAIAGVLANKPSIIVFDEPTSSLDPATQIEVMDILKRLNESGITVIMTTHDIEYIAEYTERIITMANGMIIYDGDIKELFSKDEIINSSRLRLPKVAVLVKKIFEYYGIKLDNIPLKVDEAMELIKNTFKEPFIHTHS